MQTKSTAIPPELISSGQNNIFFIVFQHLAHINVRTTLFPLFLLLFLPLSVQNLLAFAGLVPPPLVDLGLLHIDFQSDLGNFLTTPEEVGFKLRTQIGKVTLGFSLTLTKK